MIRDAVAFGIEVVARRLEIADAHEGSGRIANVRSNRGVLPWKGKGSVGSRVSDAAEGTT